MPHHITRTLIPRQPSVFYFCHGEPVKWSRSLYSIPARARQHTLNVIQETYDRPPLPALLTDLLRALLAAGLDTIVLVCWPSGGPVAQEGNPPASGSPDALRTKIRT
jgi:hypothetical protein